MEKANAHSGWTLPSWISSRASLNMACSAGIIGGSISALLVTFFLLPTAYAVLEGRHGATVRALPVPPTTERAA